MSETTEDFYGFAHFVQGGVLTVRCTEPGCAFGGPLSSWPVRARDAHARTHERERRARKAQR